MIEPSLFREEKKRAEAVKSLNLLDTPIEERFERITRQICKLLDVPIAIFNLIDSDRQHYKSVQGLDATDATLDGAFCTHALHEKDVMLVPDASKDKRFHDNPFVTGERLNIKFYAGCPVRTPDGMPVATLCAIDTKPRDLTEEQLSTLRDLAAVVENEMKLAGFSGGQKELVDLDATDRLTLIDPLTRLWNRDGISQILDRDWNDARADGGTLVLILVGIENFKKVKDILGAQILEGVLRTIGKKLIQALPSASAAGYLGDGNFMLLLKDFDDVSGSEIIRNIGKLVDNDPFVAGTTRKYPLKLRFGIATAKTSDENVQDLIVRAEKLL